MLSPPPPPPLPYTRKLVKTHASFEYRVAQPTRMIKALNFHQHDQILHKNRGQPAYSDLNFHLHTKG